jgi:hypothetical protein
MKRLIPFLLAFGLGLTIAAVVVNRNQTARHAREWETQRAAWTTEKAELEAALAKANARARAWVAAPQPRSDAGVVAPTLPDASELLNRLVALKVTTGPGQTHALRQVLALLGQLTDAGPEALPAIREFFATGHDAVFNAPGGRGARDVRALAEALIPATLRLGLFDVVRQIGGAEAESLLAGELGRTGRGTELAYLTHLLEELSPGQYRDVALAAAHTLLASATGSDRDYLFAMLNRFGDTSYVSAAQAQLLTPDGKVDRNALRYLQQTLGEQSVALAVQYYQDPRLIEPGSKEPLARLALAYVGTNPQAGQLYHTAVLDPSLSPDQKRNLVEDLNQDGLSNKKTPTPEDLKIITNRYALTQAYLQQDYVQNDKVLHAAFREADKDLRQMLERAPTAAAAANSGTPAR